MSSEGERGSGIYLSGARAALPFALATFVLGISFGVLARSLGWGTLGPIVFSVLAFSGSAQFAVASVLGSGGGALPAIAAAALLNARFGPMGVFQHELVFHAETLGFWGEILTVPKTTVYDTLV